ncbi:MAG: glycoside hydrolase family 76 protein [Myxococcales bacterium]
MTTACAPQGSDPALHANADEATGQFLAHYWSQSLQSLGYLASSWASSGGASNSATGYWTFAQGFDAVLDAAFRTGGFRGTLDTFYDAASSEKTGYSSGFSSNYYDDESWMTLALIRAYDFSGDATFLTTAESVYADIEGAWDTSCCGAIPGGLWWDRAHTQKATASNAGPVIAGVRLASRTGNAADLSFAQQAYGYWRSNFVNAANQVADHIDAATGNLVWWKFTYDEGLMIGAALELHEATGGAAYLADARAFAAWMLANETETTGAGPVLFDGTNANCNGDCEQFKGIGYRYLNELAAVDPTLAGTAVLPSSPAAIWNAARGAGDVFSADWAGPAPAASTQVDVRAVTSALMALNLGAAQQGQYPGHGYPANHLQAEEGKLNGVGLQASQPGYEGWGYVAGWGSQGQSVVLDWTVPFAGNWRLTFQYAAGAGQAVRALTVNGNLVTSSLTFPGTGAWGNWSAVHQDVSLPQGPLEIKIGFPAGSSNYLNLDYVVVKPVPCSNASLLPAFPSPAGPWNGADCCGALPAASWSAASGATSYNLVVDGAVACATGATSCSLPALAPGVHRWYVEAVDACGGNFSPESELVVSSAPAVIASPSPADGSAGVPASLSWSASPAGSSFEVALDGQPICVGLTGTTCTLAAPPASGCHQWQVTAVTGCAAAPGPVWAFSVP